ncbi:MAG: TRAP transporter small permease subunit [Syntrophaceae bacterium]|nr:TRAP transporter small permease subunit [Syntrophaceae bacterium]
MKIVSRWVEVCEHAFLASAVMGSVIISVVGVFFRYVIGSSLSWVEEIAGFLLLAIITIGIGPGARIGSHMRVDMVIQFIPKTKKSLNFVANLLTLGVTTILLVLSFEFVDDFLKRDQRLTSLYWLPVGILLIVMPLGYLIAVFRFAENFIKILKPLSEGDEKSK